MKRNALPVLSLGLLLTACMVVTPTPTPLPPRPVVATATAIPRLRQAVTLVLWHTEPEGSPAAQLLADMARRFHAQYPWITIEPVYVGAYEDLYRKALAAVRAGHPPDLATAYPAHIAGLMAAGGLVSLDLYAEDSELGLSPEEREDFFPGFWQANLYPEFDSQLLSLPYAWQALALYYNASALRAGGIEGPPKTWDEFERACHVASGGDVAGYAFVDSGMAFTGWLYSRGASLLKARGTGAAFNGPEGVDSLELLLRLLDTRVARRLEGEGSDRAAFASGKTVFTMAGTAELAAYAGQIDKAARPFAWGCTMIPQLDSANPRTVAWGASLCIFRTTEARQQAAWRFVRWFNDTEQVAEWTSTLGFAPVRRSAVEQLAASGWMEDRPLTREVYESVIPYAFPEPVVRQSLLIRRAVEDAWLATLSGVWSTQDALDMAAGRVNEAMSQ
ncbi:MAG: extracellular solute-binding protein [Anaerolineae bacterium]|nr:extracellular solute-binding protein [Anaerolineae bacterium]